MGWLKNLLNRARNPESGVEPVKPILTIEVPQDPEPAELTADQLIRANWAQAVLEKHGIPNNPYLPVIESEDAARIRTPQEVAERLTALIIVALKGEGLEQEAVDSYLDERMARPFLTPSEAAFIADPDPPEQDRMNFSWQYEAAWVLAWALGIVDRDLYYPDRIIDPGLLVRSFMETDDLATRSLLPTDEILNCLELTYRFHWATRQASIDGEQPPAGLVPGVVMERHRAFNWLTCYCDDDWDYVGTDT